MRWSPTPNILTACPTEFDALFTTDRPVIFAYHGYPWLIHRLTYRRRNHANIHVRGYKEEGTTTTPFDMLMLNDMDRFHLVIDVIDRVPTSASRASGLRQQMVDERLRHRAYTREVGDDPPDVRDWTWNAIEDASAPGALSVRVLVVNAGSSSLKLSVLDGDTPRAAARSWHTRRHVDPEGVLRRSTRLGPVDAVGHRIVHGGERYLEGRESTPESLRNCGSWLTWLRCTRPSHSRAGGGQQRPARLPRGRVL